MWRPVGLITSSSITTSRISRPGTPAFMATQPLSVPSCGSVFKNPQGDFAGRLIEASGLKGHRIGGAQISPIHANFIANTGGATAADVVALIREAEERVKQESGADLEREVRIVGGKIAWGASNRT